MTAARVAFVDAEPNGLARMIGGLIEANLLHHPDRSKLLRPARVDLAAIDADVGVALQLESGSVTIANGFSNHRADIRVSTDSLSLAELAAVPLRLGFPDPFDREGRVVIRKVLSADIRIEGLVRHPIRLSRLTRLLSVAR